MTTDNEKAPATAPTVNEGNKQLGTSSPHRLYLFQGRDNSIESYITRSGQAIPFKNHSLVIVSTDFLVKLCEAPRTISINPRCLAHNNVQVRKVRAEKAARERAALRNKIAYRLRETEFGPEFEAAEKQLWAAEDDVSAIEERVQARTTELLDQADKILVDDAQALLDSLEVPGR